MEKPVRVQLKRTKGWKMPANTVKVTRGKGRAGRFGNPFKVGQEPGCLPYVEMRHGAIHVCYDKPAAIRAAVDLFREYAAKLPVAELRGKNLACFCPLDQPCHADVLLELANPSPNKNPQSDGGKG